MKRIIIRRAAALIIAACLCVALCGGAMAMEAGWKCPNCGRENPERANFCGSCRTQRPTATVTVDARSNAWVCDGCGAVCADEDAFCMICGADQPANGRRALLIDPVPRLPVSFPAAQILAYQGKVGNDEINRFAYTVPTDGVYYVYLGEVVKGFVLHVRVLDRQGASVNGAYLAGGEGVAAELKAGEVYTIEVEQYSDTGAYTLYLGVANPHRGIDAYQIIQDSAVFENQMNVYEYTAPFDGMYSFKLRNLVHGLVFHIEAFDGLGYRQNGSYLSNEESMNVELKAGERYLVCVSQYSGLGTYTLEIGAARARTDVSGLGAVGDELYFDGQQVEYTYTAQESGRYVLTLGMPQRGEVAHVAVFDLDGYRLISAYLSNGEDFSVDLEAPKAYVIQVEQYTGFDSYTLSIGH